MTYRIAFEKYPDHIAARVTGTNSRQAVVQYMEEVLAECLRSDCFRLLIHETLEGPRLDVLEIFSLVSQGSMKLLGQFEAIAYVDEQMGSMADFAETVAINRGLPIAFFGTVNEATEWLSRHGPGSNERDIFHPRRTSDDN